MMDGFHWTDLLVLVGLGLLIFGSKRSPEIGSSVGAALREMRNALREGSLPLSNTPSDPNTTSDTTPATPTAPGENTASAESAEPAESGEADETQHVETGPPV